MMRYRYVDTNGIRLWVGQDGSDQGQLVILLHGFPEYSFGWRRQIPYLAAAGYRVWAPDQRGYNQSDKPEGISAYALDELAADVVGLIDAANVDQAYLVAHDLGATVAWWVATRYPHRLARMVIMNVPHGAVMKKNLFGSPAQLRKSWYIFFFQLPWLPEALARRKHWAFASSAMTKTSIPGTFTESDLDRYRQSWSRPNAYSSMLNWYRALIRKPPKLSENSRIVVPTLLIWGAQDTFLVREMAQQSIDLCDDGRLVFIEEATHWVHHEEAERVNMLVHAFLRREG